MAPARKQTLFCGVDLAYALSMSGINNFPPPKQSTKSPKGPSQGVPGQSDAVQRAARRAEALKANLKRRKAGPDEKDVSED
jgi:hypothetical protein